MTTENNQESNYKPTPPAVLVIGGGIAGIQASLDLGDRGMKVYLVERSPTIGGRMAQLDKTFPTMDCSICILAPKMTDCGRHPNIELLTYSEVEKVEGKIGDFHVTVLKHPRFIDYSKCTGCEDCVAKCPVAVSSEFNVGLSKRKAISIPFPQAIPRKVTIDEKNCLYFTKDVCRLCERYCKAGAINLDDKPERVTMNVGAIIIATGFDLFDSSKITEYGYGKYENVLTALEFERYASASGPTRGEIIRPSDGRHPKRIAFIQCVGSRDLDRGQPYCSSICCMHATKEALMAKEHDPEILNFIFYNDLRTFGKGFYEFALRAQFEYGIQFIRALPGEVRENPLTKNLTIWFDETFTREVTSLEVDMVVLCPAMVPRSDSKQLAEILGINLDEYGFLKSSDLLGKPVDTNVPGIYIAGFCEGPKDIPDSVAQASGAAARAAEAVAENWRRKPYERST